MKVVIFPKLFDSSSLFTKRPICPSPPSPENVFRKQRRPYSRPSFRVIAFTLFPSLFLTGSLVLFFCVTRQTPHGGFARSGPFSSSRIYDYRAAGLIKSADPGDGIRDSGFSSQLAPSVSRVGVLMNRVRTFSSPPFPLPAFDFFLHVFPMRVGLAPRLGRGNYQRPSPDRSAFHLPLCWGVQTKSGGSLPRLRFFASRVPCIFPLPLSLDSSALEALGGAFCLCHYFFFKAGPPSFSSAASQSRQAALPSSKLFFRVPFAITSSFLFGPPSFQVVCGRRARLICGFWRICQSCVCALSSFSPLHLRGAEVV